MIGSCRSHRQWVRQTVWMGTGTRRSTRAADERCCSQYWRSRCLWVWQPWEPVWAYCPGSVRLDESPAPAVVPAGPPRSDPLGGLIVQPSVDPEPLPGDVSTGDPPAPLVAPPSNPIELGDAGPAPGGSADASGGTAPTAPAAGHSAPGPSTPGGTAGGPPASPGRMLMTGRTMTTDPAPMTAGWASMMTDEVTMTMDPAMTAGLAAMTVLTTDRAAVTVGQRRRALQQRTRRQRTERHQTW